MLRVRRDRVVAPLPHVAVHVIQTPRVWPLQPDRVRGAMFGNDLLLIGGEAALAERLVVEGMIAGVTAEPAKRIAGAIDVEFRIGSGTTGIFPLGFGG